jgi:transposase
MMQLGTKPVKELSVAYNLSSSTLSRIVKQFKTHPWSKEMIYKKVGSKIIKSKIVSQFIAMYLKDMTSPFTSKDVAVFLKERLNIVVSEENIRHILKKQLNLSFKKGSSRPWSLDAENRSCFQYYLDSGWAKGWRGSKHL